MKSLHVTALLAGCATLAAVGTALRADIPAALPTRICIFEEGNFNMRAGVTIVMPQRGYETDHGAGKFPARWYGAGSNL